eukprot:1207910-Prymnesium_polylepis.1
MAASQTSSSCCCEALRSHFTSGRRTAWSDSKISVSAATQPSDALIVLLLFQLWRVVRKTLAHTMVATRASSSCHTQKAIAKRSMRRGGGRGAETRKSWGEKTLHTSSMVTLRSIRSKCA